LKEEKGNRRQKEESRVMPEALPKVFVVAAAADQIQRNSSFYCWENQTIGDFVIKLHRDGRFDRSEQQ